MWLIVAKGVQRLLQGVPIGSNGGFKEAQFQGGFQGGFQEKVLPDVAKCRQRGSKGFQRAPSGFKGFQWKVLPDVAKKRQRGSKGKCYQMWQKVAKGVPKVFQDRPTLFAKAHGLGCLPDSAGAP